MGLVENSSAGTRRIRAVLGLGNPGSQYGRTRHNAGFLVVEKLGEASATWKRVEDREETILKLPQGPALLARPLTYMNRSGRAAERLLLAHGITPSELLVVADDVYLPWGRLRLRASGGTGGHRGLASLREHLGTDEFPRLRVGVGAPSGEDPLADFVLAPLEGEAWEEFMRLIDRAAEAVRAIWTEGLAAAMTRYNAAPED